MSKLWKICDVVRRELGLDNVPFQYDVQTKDRHIDEQNSAMGSTFMLPRGVAGLIDFWPLFFRVDPIVQLTTIIHEHLHVRLMPYYQIMNGLLDRDRFTHAEEQIIDQLATPLSRLIRPKVRAVWNMRYRLTRPAVKRYTT